jgi:uncharacterized protein (DUF4415 family)
MKRKPNPQKADRENPAWAKETFARARKARTSISIRLPPETLARWKATGPGWQTRMAEALSRAV